MKRLAVERMPRASAAAATPRGIDDLELAVARAGCALLDREKAGDTSGKLKADVERLKRWCAARLHDRAYRDWVVFRFPETLDYWHSSRCSVPSRAARSDARPRLAPAAARRLQADRRRA